MKDRVVNALALCSFSGLVLIKELLEIEVTERLYLADEFAALVAAIFVAFAYGLASKYVFVRRDSKMMLLLGLLGERWDGHSHRLSASSDISEVGGDLRGRA
jgi:hypothetical protein